MEDNKNIKELIRNKKYNMFIQILKNKIIEYIVEIIKEKEKDYEYTNIIDLIQLSEKYIEDERKNIAKNIEYFSFEEDKLVVLDRLLEICDIYNIK